MINVLLASKSFNNFHCKNALENQSWNQTHQTFFLHKKDIFSIFFQLGLPFYSNCIVTKWEIIRASIGKQRKTKFGRNDSRKVNFRPSQSWVLTWWMTRNLRSCCRCRRRTSPTTTSLGTTSRSRKNSDRTRAMSANELWKQFNYLRQYKND